jgi:hypothetical protein
MKPDPAKLDPVLAEIRATREAYAERFAGDVKGMLADLRKRQKQSGRKVVSRSAKRCLQIGEAPQAGRSQNLGDNGRRS